MNPQNNINAYTDLAHFGAIRKQATQSPNSAVTEVAKEFEALFIEMMLSSARKASIKGGMFESNALELYREMFDSQAARVLSERGTLGFEKAISRFVGIEDGENSSPSQPESGSNESRNKALPNSPPVPVQATLSIPARRADLPLLNYHISNPAKQVTVPAQTNASANIDIGEVQTARLEHVQEKPARIAAPAYAGSHQQLSFSQKIAPYAEEAAKLLGTDPAILVAQAALESGWGKHVIPGHGGASSNNLFGIKANNQWQGGSTEVKTFEFLGGRPIKTSASFRSYSDIKASFDDYVKFVTENPRYQRAVENAPDADRYIRELAKAGYATDPKYAEKVISIKNRINQMNSHAHNQSNSTGLGNAHFDSAASSRAN